MKKKIKIYTALAAGCIGVLVLGTVGIWLCRMEKPEDVVRKTFRKNISWEEFLSCHVKSSREIPFWTASDTKDQRKLFERMKKSRPSSIRFIAKKVTINGDLCEVEFELENVYGTARIWLRKEDGQWRIDRKLSSEKYRKERYPALSRECTEKLKHLGSVLLKYAGDNGTFPQDDGKNVFSKKCRTWIAKEWQTLTDKKYLISDSEYRCPVDGKPYDYISGQKHGLSGKPLIYCDRHRDQTNREYLNVLFCDGHVGKCAISDCRSRQLHTNRPRLNPRMQKPSSAVDGKDISSWLPGPTEQWHIRMDTALSAVRKEHKKIFVLFTDSDGSSLCRKLFRDVFSSSDFINMAKDRLILVCLDKPARKPMPQFQRLYNTEVGHALRSGGGVPCACIFDERGLLTGTISGYRPLPQYMQTLQKILDSTGIDSRLRHLPLWVRNSPEQLKPVLEQRQAERKKAAGYAEKTAENVKRNASFQLIAWGLNKNDVNRPFDSMQEIRVPVRTKIYVRVKYSLPPDISSRLSLYGNQKRISADRPRISGNGETVCVLFCSRPCRQDKIRFQMWLALKESRPFIAYEIPCLLVWEQAGR